MKLKNKIESNVIIDIRFNEIDLYNVVWNGHYLGYFEWARQQILDRHGLGYDNLLEMDCLLPLIHAELDFKKAIRYADKQILVAVSLLHNTVPKFIFQYEIYNLSKTELFCKGQTHHALVNHEWKILASYPEALWKKLQSIFFDETPIPQQ